MWKLNPLQKGIFFFFLFHGLHIFDIDDSGPKTWMTKKKKKPGVPSINQGATEHTAQAIPKRKCYSTLIPRVGNIIYQIKRVAAGKLCTNYTVSHRRLCSMTATARTARPRHAWVKQPSLFHTWHTHTHTGPSASHWISTSSTPEPRRRYPSTLYSARLLFINAPLPPLSIIPLRHQVLTVN